MTAPSYPRLVAAPEMKLAEVIDRSAVLMSVPRVTDGLCAAQALQLHALELRHPSLGFVLEPGRFALLKLVDATVVGIHASPHLEYLDAAESVALLERCGAVLRTANWELDGTFSADQARTVASHVGAAFAGTWRAPRWTAQLGLRRVHAANSPLARTQVRPRDLFLVTLALRLAVAGV